MAKTRINLSIDEDLAEYVKDFAAANRVSVADVVTQYVLELKRRDKGGRAGMPFSNPAFMVAFEDARERIRAGKAEWHTFGEVFGDGTERGTLDGGSND